MPCLGCLKKYSVPPLLICLCFPPGPTSRRRDSAAKLRLVFAAVARDAERVLPFHTSVCTPVSTELGQLRAAPHLPWGCGGSLLQGDARASATMARSFLPMREEEVGGLGMEEKGRAEGCNAWLEKFRGVQRRAAMKRGGGGEGGRRLRAGCRGGGRRFMFAGWLGWELGGRGEPRAGLGMLRGV